MVVLKKGERKVPFSRTPAVLSVTEESGIPLKNAASATTFSISADANRSNCVSTSTFNTLSMISTPWSTESGFSFIGIESEPSSSESTTFPTWTKTEDSLSSLSINPRSSTTTDIPTPTVGSLSKTTLTLISFAMRPSYSHNMPMPATVHTPPGDTLSSWTWENLTDSPPSRKSHALRVKYPWSPATLRSATDYYPSSLDSLASRKGSRVTITPRTCSTKDVLIPMNYMPQPSNEDNPVFDWTLAKQNGLPNVCTANVIYARV